jgi:beta-phosphoglucomutase family hydrolase
MKPNSTAYIFDMDGVICHNIPYHKKAWAKFMTNHGFKFTNKFFDTHINGQTNEEILNRIFGKKLTVIKTKKFVEEKESIYRKIYTPHIKPLPGLLDFLKHLTKIKAKIALATSGPEENVKFTLGKTKTQKYFKVIVDSRDIKNGKPHPEVFLKAAKKLKTQPKNCLVFEDSILGVEAGKRADMQVIGILTSYSKKQLHLADGFAKDFTKIKIV